MFGDSVSDSQEGGQTGRADWEEDMEEAEDAPEMTKEFYSEVRWISAMSTV